MTHKMRLLMLVGVGCFSATAANAQVKIAQIYGGASSAGAAWANDYVVLKNTSSSPVSINNYVLHYASTTGAFSGTNNRVVLTGTIPGNGWFLIQLAPGTAGVGAPLPLTPDQTSVSINAATTAGKFALTSTNVALTTTCPTGGTLVDFVGYGSGPNCSEGTVAPAPSIANSLFRRGDGCTDFNNNSFDFFAQAATAADFRNTSSTPSGCAANQADYGVTLATNPTCETAPGAAASTATITLTNTLGGNPLANPVVTLNLPAELTYNANTPSQGSATHSSGVVTWNPGALAPGASATLNVTLDAAATAGVYNLTTNVTTADLDPVSTNNSATKAVEIINTAASVQKIFLCNLPATPSNRRQITTLDTLAARDFTTATGEAFGRIWGSADGTKFCFLAVLDATNAATDRVLLVGDSANPVSSLTAVVQKGFTDLGTGETVTTFDGNVYINNAGQMAFSGVTSLGSNNDVVVRRNVSPSVSYDIMAREGGATQSSISTAGGPVAWGTINNATGITTDGRVLFYSNFTGGDVSGTTNDTGITLATDPTNTASILRREATTAVGVGAVPSGEGANWKVFDTGSGVGPDSGSHISADGNTLFLTGTISTAATANDQVAVLNNDMVIQEGKEMPPTAPYLGSLTASSFLKGSTMDAQGNWIANGSNVGVGEDWAVRNGVSVARTGDPITPSSNETWSDSNLQNPGSTTGFADCFFSVGVQGNDYIVGGFTSNSDLRRNVVYVHNGTTVICREGDPVDVNNDGLANDGAYVGTFRNGRIWISSDRKAYFGVTLRNSNGACGTPADIGQAILVVQLPEPATAGCSPADIAYGDGEPLPPIGQPGGFNPVGPDGGDFDCFFNFYFAPAPDNAVCDIAYGDGEPLPPYGQPGGFNPGVDGGDFDCFFNYYFNGCL